MLLEEKIRILNKVLKQKAKIRKGTDAVYFCPKCKHHKRKLEVNLNTGKYNCWVCNFSGLNLNTLLRKVGAPKECYSQLDLIKSERSSTVASDVIKLDFTDKVKSKDIVCLPDEFKPLNVFCDSSEYKTAIKYLVNRGITKYDIFRYQIGYCDSGVYRQRIIIPSYDKEGELNFFVGRSYTDSTLRYSNSETSKDVIGFESLVDFTQELTLVEGVFDAMAVRYNCIPLFGKNLSNRLREALVSNPVPVVNVMLDFDAYKNSVRIVDFLMKNNIRTRFINIGKFDASVLGFEETWKIIRNSSVLDFESMLSIKMKENYECDEITV